MRTLLLVSCAAGPIVSLFSVSPAAAKTFSVSRTPSFNLLISVNGGDQRRMATFGNKLTFDLEVTLDRQHVAASILDWQWAHGQTTRPFANDRSTNIWAHASLMPAAGTQLPDTVMAQLELTDGRNGPTILTREIMLPTNTWDMVIDEMRPIWPNELFLEMSLQSPIDVPLFDEMIQGEQLLVTAHRIETSPLLVHLQVPEPSTWALATVAAVVLIAHCRRRAQGGAR